MIILELLLKIHPNKRTVFIQTFEMMGTRDSAKKGCLVRTIFEQVDKVNNFLWREQCENQAALDLYSQGHRFGGIMGGYKYPGRTYPEKNIYN